MDQYSNGEVQEQNAKSCSKVEKKWSKTEWYV
jgi:hypothetical protein